MSKPIVDYVDFGDGTLQPMRVISDGDLEQDMPRSTEWDDLQKTFAGTVEVLTDNLADRDRLLAQVRSDLSDRNRMVRDLDVENKRLRERIKEADAIVIAATAYRSAQLICERNQNETQPSCSSEDQQNAIQHRTRMANHLASVVDAYLEKKPC